MDGPVEDKLYWLWNGFRAVSLGSIPAHVLASLFANFEAR